MSAVARDRLPDRRMQITERVEWNGWTLLFSIGFATDGSAREIFADGSKSGHHIEDLLDDACVLVSLCLQNGYRAADLADHVGRDGPDSGQAASPIGTAVACAARVEAQAGDAIRRAYNAERIVDLEARLMRESAP